MLRGFMVLAVLLLAVGVVGAEAKLLKLRTNLNRDQLEDAMRNDPGFYYSLGNFLAKNGYFISAAHFLTKGLGVGAKAHHNLGVVYCNQGKPGQAEIEFRKAIELDNDYAKAYYSLGILQFEVGDLEEAVRNLVKAAELDQKNYNALFDTGIALGRLGRWDEAKQYFWKAYEANPDFTVARQNFEFILQRSAES